MSILNGAAPRMGRTSMEGRLCIAPWGRLGRKPSSASAYLADHTDVVELLKVVGEGEPVMPPLPRMESE